MKYTCPQCGGLIYNRRVKHCEFCQQALPSALVYSDDDIKTLNERENVKSDNHLRSKNGSSGGYLGDLFDYSDTTDASCGD